MTVSCSRSRLLGCSVVMAIAIFDQITKVWAFSWLESQGGFFQVTSIFNLVAVENPGISFGMFGNTPPPGWLLAAISGSITGVLILWLWRTDDRWLAVGIGLIIGGAFGNIIDRFSREGVADFLDFHWGKYHWPAFNLADSAITVGVCMILMHSLLFQSQRGN